MIVDLERNDLSRVCEPGSVRWPELMAEHELAGVVHMVSTVEGRLREGVGLAELLEATFPGGSVTGAPKISAIDHIAALEPVGRGASMGAIGRVYPNGDLDLALTIRTFAVAEGRIHLWVGGGIVWDSEPEAEIEESLVKARPLLDAIGAPLPRRSRTARTGRRPPVPTRRTATSDRALSARRRTHEPEGSHEPARGRGRRARPRPPDEPVLLADDEALLRGRAAFETLRVYGGRPFRIARAPGADARLGRAARHRVRRTGSSSSPPRRSTAAGEPDAVLRLYLTRAARARARPVSARARQLAARPISRSAARAGSR